MSDGGKMISITFKKRTPNEDEAISESPSRADSPRPSKKPKTMDDYNDDEDDFSDDPAGNNST